MPLKKLILPAGVLLAVLSCHQAPKPEITTSYDINFETLHGKVKQLVEMYTAYLGVPLETDVTDFDTAGNVIQMRNTGHCNCLTKYVYTYDKTGKKISITTKDSTDDVYFPKPLYKYDRHGHIVEMSSQGKIDTEFPNVVVQYKCVYKYDAAGDRVQLDFYSDNEQGTRMKYKYNQKHLLIEEWYLYALDSKKLRGSRTTYHYTSFDSKGNWLKQVGKVKDYGPPIQEIPEPVVTRKITYY